MEGNILHGRNHFSTVGLKEMPLFMEWWPYHFRKLREFSADKSLQATLQATFSQLLYLANCCYLHELMKQNSFGLINPNLLIWLLFGSYLDDMNMLMIISWAHHVIASFQMHPHYGNDLIYEYDTYKGSNTSFLWRVSEDKCLIYSTTVGLIQKVKLEVLCNIIANDPDR